MLNGFIMLLFQMNGNIDCLGKDGYTWVWPLL